MFIEDPNDLDDIERMIKFNEIAEEYGRHIAAFETAPWVTEYDLLIRAGIELPAPQELDDEALTALLWRIIENLATRNTFCTIRTIYPTARYTRNSGKKSCTNPPKITPPYSIRKRLPG